MKTFIKSSLSVLKLIFIATILAGCIDEPVAPQNYIINGKVVGCGECYLSTGEYPIFPSDYSGNFQMYVPVNPFDLKVVGSYSYFITKYNNISIDTLNIVCDDLDYEFYFDSYYCYANVTFPSLNERKYISIKFISPDNFIQIGDGDLYAPGEELVSLRVYIPKEKQNISGKLVYLEMTIEDYGQIDSFDKFGVKDVTLSPVNIEQQINFYENEISFNPPEVYTTVYVNHPAYPAISNDFYILFPDMSSGSNLKLPYYNDYFYNSTLTPILPDINISLKFRNRMSNLLDNFYAEKEIIVKPGTFTTTSYPQTIDLLLPENNALNINDTSRFEFSDDSGPAIYEYLFYNNNKYYKYVTTEKSVRVSDLKTNGFEFKRNESIKWTVRKIPGYVSMDDFVKEFYTVSRKYDYIELSNLRQFKTAP